MLKIEKITILPKYANFIDVFSSDSAAELYKHTIINNHSINLVNNMQPLFGPIYSLRLVELETLKTYIQTNLVNGLIQPTKLPADTQILFVCKKNNSFKLFVNYQDLNNLTIKNRYLFPLIGKLLDRLGRAKDFI